MEIRWKDTNIPGVRSFRTSERTYYFSVQVFGATLEMESTTGGAMWGTRQISRRASSVDEPLTDLQLLEVAERLIRRGL